MLYCHCRLPVANCSLHSHDWGVSGADHGSGMSDSVVKVSVCVGLLSYTLCTDPANIIVIKRSTGVSGP